MLEGRTVEITDLIMQFPSHEQVLNYRARYEGRRIRFVAHGEPDPCPLEPGILGVVEDVDDGGILHPKWDNGRTLGLVIGSDRFEVVRQFPERGKVSPRFGHLGMWNLSLGPNSPIPGQRLEVAILDLNGTIVRRFEQIRGACTDPGYADFFMSHNCRPASHEYPIVDIDEKGKVAEVIIGNYSQSMGMDLYLQLLEKWVTKHGKPEWAIPLSAVASQVVSV